MIMNEIASVNIVGTELILRHTDTFAVGIIGNVLVSRWRSPSTLEGLRWVREAAHKILATHAQHATLTLVSPLPSLTMSDEAYAEVERIKEDFRGRRAAAAYVVEVPGFSGSALTEVLRGMMVGNRNDCPTRVFHDLREGCAWLAPFSTGAAAGDLIAFARVL